MIILYVLIGINFLLNCFLIYKAWDENSKKTIGIILSKDKKTIDYKKFNPSDKKFEHNDMSYILPFEPFIKYKNKRFVLYEHNNPEPLPLMVDNDRLLTGDVLNELLKMSKIKALNEVKKGIFGNITGTQILIGLVIAVGVFLVIKQFT